MDSFGYSNGFQGGEIGLVKILVEIAHQFFVKTFDSRQVAIAVFVDE